MILYVYQNLNQKQKMCITRTSLLMILLIYCLAFIDGPKVLSLSSSPLNMAMSDDGSIIVTTYGNAKDAEVFEKAIDGFVFSQRLPSSTGAEYVAISASNSIVLNVGAGSVKYYIRGASGNYEVGQTLLPPSTILDVSICANEEYIAAAVDSNYLKLYQKSSGTFSFHSVSSCSSGYPLKVAFSHDCQWLAYACSNGDVKIFGNLPPFTWVQTLPSVRPVFSVAITTSTLLISIVSPPDFHVKIYHYTASQFKFSNSKQIQFQVASTPSFQFYMDGITSNQLSIYAYNSSNSLATLDFRYTFLTGSIFHLAINADATLFACVNDDQNLYVFQRRECPTQCSSCSSNYCSACVEGYSLEDGKCLPHDNPCVGNRTYKNGVCEEFCHEKCKSCGETWTECKECAALYMREGGDCVMSNGLLSIISKIRPFLALLRSSGVKSFLFVVSDLRLYEYHQKKYDGLAKQVFVVARFIEDKQWEIVGLLGVKEGLESSIEVASHYYPLSNPTYLNEERKSNLFVQSTMDYFVFFLPLTLVLVVLFNRLFYCLFNYQISRCLRIYSFWWVFMEILVQRNIEFFTFLGFRNFKTMFHFDIASKLLVALNLLMFFLTLIVTFHSYFHYYLEYGRLAKYFLANMFRFPSSYALMIIVYGLKPFAKGIIHAMLYEEWVAQIWSLLGIELLTVVIVCVFEFRNDNHRSKVVFMLDVAYSGCFILLNLLLLLKYEYLDYDQGLMDFTEEIIASIIYAGIGLFCLKLLWEFLPLEWMNKQLCLQEDDEESENEENSNERSQNGEDKKDEKGKKEKGKKEKGNKGEKEEKKKERKKTKKIQKDKKEKKKEKKKKKEQRQHEREPTPREMKREKEEKGRKQKTDRENRERKKEEKRQKLMKIEEKEKKEIPTIQLDWKKRE